MKTAVFALLVCMCTSVQAQEVRLEYADPLGNGAAFLGPDEIAIDLVLDIPVTAEALGAGTIEIQFPASTSFSGASSPLPLCPDPDPCVSEVIDTGLQSLQIIFEAVQGFSNGQLTLATIQFDANAVGAANFFVDGAGFIQPPGTGGAPYPGIDFFGTTIDIVDGEAGVSGSLPQEFENTVGVPANWSTFFNPAVPRGSGTLWRSSAEAGVCDFGNVTGGAGNASCLQGTQSAKRGGAAAGSFLCTDSPLDASGAVPPPILGLLANFQPNPGGATFRVISGNTPPPNIAAYTTRFETNDALGQFASLPGASLTIPLPAETPLYICIGVEGDYAYAEVDECVSCAVSFGQGADNDGDGVADSLDNCVDTFNPDQRDTDADSIGNACDADIAPAANDCVVNSLDMQAIKLAFFSQAGHPGYNPDADFDGDDVVNFSDLGVMKQQFFGPPGPSGLPNACDDGQRGIRLRDCGIPD